MEGYLCIRVYAQRAEARTGHLRTFSGNREVDLIVEAQDKRVVAVEVKLKRTIKDDDTRNLRWLMETIGDELLDAIVVTTGETAYRRPDGIGVVPAARRVGSGSALLERANLLAFIEQGLRIGQGSDLLTAYRRRHPD
jgi:predicted AAA+ superfamily ATPase